jgi:diguanylate cyclase (GGDEF)-like protein
MDERRNILRSRMLRGGKILLHKKSSVIDCTVRNLSPEGACLQVASVIGIPVEFDLAIEGEVASSPCRVVWQSETRLGVSFKHQPAAIDDTALEPTHTSELPHEPEQPANPERPDLIRGEMLRLRAALDHVKFGIVLLDQEMRAQFINRAFRRMWRLSDAKAESRPAFVALMYHGRDTRAYDVPEDDLDAYVAERVAHVKSGDPSPRDLRLANGEVLRFQCIVLPDGGRMLSYTFITDIIEQRDELEALRAGFDNVPQGVMLLDAQFNTQFMNHVVRERWGISEEQAARKPPFSELMAKTRFTKIYGVPPEQLEVFISERLASIKRGDSQPIDVRTGDGRTVRAQCTVLPNGGRMLTYTDVTDLVRSAETLERLATIDGMTGAYNRRHFLLLAEAEWSRFQRYHRPLSLMAIDIDNLKQINDQYGHDAGDRAIMRLCDLCRESKRAPDIVARLGGDEFALLLPETELPQAAVVAERLRAAMAASPLAVNGTAISMTVSIGIAESQLAQPSFDALIKVADQALYRCKERGRNQIARAVPKAPSDYRTAAE